MPGRQGRAVHGRATRGSVRESRPDEAGKGHCHGRAEQSKASKAGQSRAGQCMVGQSEAVQGTADQVRQGRGTAW